MDFSANNTALWSPIVQIGIIAGLILAYLAVLLFFMLKIGNKKKK